MMLFIRYEDISIEKERGEKEEEGRKRGKGGRKGEKEKVFLNSMSFFKKKSGGKPLYTLLGGDPQAPPG